MNRAEYNTFKKTGTYRVPLYLWESGFIVASPGQIIATLVFHNWTEALVLFAIGLIMMLPWLGVNLWLLSRLYQEQRRLETELIVHETLLKIFYPKEYKRRQDIKAVEKLFKKSGGEE